MNNIDEFLRALNDRGGSDLHLIDGTAPKARIHGRLETLQADLVDVRPILEPLLDDRHRKQFEDNGQVDLAYEVPGVARFRVNIFLQHHGVGAVFRTIPRRIPSLDELNISDEVVQFTNMKHGLVLVTGPTGSGKSSTLAALLNVINLDEKRHIVTIEDPIEFRHNNVESTFTQREVGRDTASFADALRSAARQSPDLVLVGEMRDQETIRLALTLAEMGMLVFSTLHTNSASRTIDRIVEVFPDAQQSQVRSMLSGSLRGVLSQILCRRIDDTGRIPATELMFNSTAMQAIIRKGEAHKMESMIQAGKSVGMHRMDDSLFRLVSEGAIAGEEAYRKANDKGRFQRFVGEA
jgi:twitching motility protein PilT